MHTEVLLWIPRGNNQQHHSKEEQDGIIVHVATTIEMNRSEEDSIGGLAVKN